MDVSARGAFILIAFFVEKLWLTKDSLKRELRGAYCLQRSGFLLFSRHYGPAPADEQKGDLRRLLPEIYSGNRYP
jgi:hypothetical protein